MSLDEIVQHIAPMHVRDWKKRREKISVPRIESVDVDELAFEDGLL